MKRNSTGKSSPKTTATRRPAEVATKETTEKRLTRGSPRCFQDRSRHKKPNLSSRNALMMNKIPKARSTPMEKYEGSLKNRLTTSRTFLSPNRSTAKRNGTDVIDLSYN